MFDFKRLGAASLLAFSLFLGGCLYRHDYYDDRARPAGYYERDERWHRDHDRDFERHDFDRREEHRRFD